MKAQFVCKLSQRQNESRCYVIYLFFCIAGTLGNNQLPALVNNKQHKPSSRPSYLLSGQHHFFLFFSFFKLLLIFLKPLVNHFDTAEKCWALQSKVIEDVLYFKKKKKAETVWEEKHGRSNEPTFFDCAKHRTIKRYIYIQQTILCKHGKYVSFQKTWSYHKYRQHWHRQTSRNEHSGLLRCSPKPQKPTGSGLKNNNKSTPIRPEPFISVYNGVFGNLCRKKVQLNSVGKENKCASHLGKITFYLSSSLYYANL